MIAILLQVRVLVEEGKADLAVTDRWGATPLDEAMRVGSRATMDYLQVRTRTISPSGPIPMKLQKLLDVSNKRYPMNALEKYQPPT